LPLLKKRGLKIGLISNGLQSDVNEILPKAGLQDFFDTVVVIDTLRKMKPDVQVFHHALEELKTTSSKAIFIGDEFEADYKGAKRAGLMAYLIDHEDKVHDESVDKISSLYDLFRLNMVK
jgi:putative hydrolase of the HAD superfamily